MKKAVFMLFCALCPLGLQQLHLTLTAEPERAYAADEKGRVMGDGPAMHARPNLTMFSAGNANSKISRSTSPKIIATFAPKKLKKDADMTIIAWCPECTKLEVFLDANNIFYRRDYISRGDHTWKTISNSAPEGGTPVIRIPIHNNNHIQLTSIGHPICRMIASLIQAEQKTGGCIVSQ